MRVSAVDSRERDDRRKKKEKIHFSPFDSLYNICSCHYVIESILPTIEKWNDESKNKKEKKSFGQCKYCDLCVMYVHYV